MPERASEGRMSTCAEEAAVALRQRDAAVQAARSAADSRRRAGMQRRISTATVRMPSTLGQPGHADRPRLGAFARLIRLGRRRRRESWH